MLPRTSSPDEPLLSLGSREGHVAEEWFTGCTLLEDSPQVGVTHFAPVQFLGHMVYSTAP